MESKLKIIEIYATRRSGHHALISWIIANITNQTHNFNKHLNSVERFNNLIHINDALFNKQIAKKTFIDNKNTTPIFLLNYEENDISESIVENETTEKVIFIRDFLNVMASKIAAPNMQSMYGGLEDENIIKENIFTWKRLAKHFINTDTHKIKYEDLISNDVYRNDFLLNLTGIEDSYDPLNLKGTNSSFTNNYDPSELNSRYKKVNFSENFKKICSEDEELINIIDKLNYTDIKNIL